jgi:hypothetical protein
MLDPLELDLLPPASKMACDNCNMAQRPLDKIRTEHLQRLQIVKGNGLAGDSPHIRLLQNLAMPFVWGANLLHASRHLCLKQTADKI